jgi:hypothetical protein
MLRSALKARAKAIGTRLLDQRGYAVIPKNLAYDWQLSPILAPSHAASDLTLEQTRYLQPDNPMLRDLQQRYAKFNPAVTTPFLWQEGYVTHEDLKYFRGDTAFRWQLRGRNYSYISYVVSTYYLKAIDQLGLFDRLDDDNAFGNYQFEIDGQLVSSDLLDSIAELNFLERHLRVSVTPMRMLDIGAGYGRLAHRAARALPHQTSFWCTDAIAVSSFLCEFYLKYRKVDDRTKTVFLDQVQNTLTPNSVDLAINIHSFSECRLEAIDWWISELARKSVRYLFIVPNAIVNGGATLATNDGTEFESVITRYGYRLRAKEPKYLRPEIQELGFCPSYHHLFERA